MIGSEHSSDDTTPQAMTRRRKRTVRFAGRRNAGVALVAVRAQRFRYKLTQRALDFLGGGGGWEWDQALLGVVQVRWTSSCRAVAPTSEVCQAARDVADATRFSPSPFTHYVEYSVDEVRLLDAPVEFDRATFRDVVAHLGWQTDTAALVLAPFASAALDPGTTFFCSGFRRSGRGRLRGFGGVPSLRAALASLPPPAPDINDTDARREERTLTATQIVRTLKASRHHKSTMSSEQCLKDWIDASFEDADVQRLEPLRRRPPFGAFLARCRPKFDICMMLMQRSVHEKWSCRACLPMCITLQTGLHLRASRCWQWWSPRPDKA